MVSATHLPISGQGVGGGGEGLLLLIVNETQISFSDNLVAPGEA